MNNVFYHSADTPPSVASLITWKHTEADSNPDVEAAILLRSLVLPIFIRATNWRELRDELDVIGFGLAIRNGHLTLTTRTTGDHICTGAFLGMPLAKLAARMGKPAVHPLGEGNGQLLI